MTNEGTKPFKRIYRRMLQKTVVANDIQPKTFVMTASEIKQITYFQ
jgi:hypothetical protein